MSKQIDMEVIGKLTAGFTGAELMNVINTSAIVAGRQQETAITEDNIIEALEDVQNQRLGLMSFQDFETGETPDYLKRSFAVYEAGRAILAHMQDEYDEVRKIVICPNNRPRSFIQFVPPESMLETGIQTLSYMRSKLTVILGGRCAERMVSGDAYLGQRSVNDFEDA